jgi:hypothetical protein
MMVASFVISLFLLHLGILWNFSCGVLKVHEGLACMVVGPLLIRWEPAFHGNRPKGFRGTKSAREEVPHATGLIRFQIASLDDGIHRMGQEGFSFSHYHGLITLQRMGFTK